MFTFSHTVSDQCDLHHPYGSNTCKYVSQGLPAIAHPKTVGQGCASGCGQMGEGGGGGGEGCESEAVRVKCGDVKGYGAVCANEQEANRDTTTETEVKVRRIHINVPNLLYD